MTQLTPHFTLEEMTRSDYAIRQGISNAPESDSIVTNLTWLCAMILEPVRIALDKPITILSGYRSEIVNRGIGGAIKPISQHTKGEAADIIVHGMTVTDLYDFIKTSGLAYDQIIHEFNAWVHVSYKHGGGRKSNLIAVKGEQRQTVYIPDTV